MNIASSPSTWRLGQSTQLLQSIFRDPGQPSSPFFRGTMALCTAVSAVSLIVDTKVIFARAGGNRFAIEDAVDDQRQVTDHCTVSRSGIKAGRYYTLVTSLFNHASLAHVVGNVLGLYNAGRTLRSVPFLLLFYGGGVVGNLLCLVLDARTGRVIGSTVSGCKVRAAGVYLGASGGVAALMAFMSCCFPRALVTMYEPFPLRLPFWMHTVGFAAYCSWAQLSGSDEGIAHLGHLGGLVWGFAYFIGRFRQLPQI